MVQQGLHRGGGPAVFVECANMRGADDARRTADSAWRQSAAQAVTDGVLAFLAAR